MAAFTLETLKAIDLLMLELVGLQEKKVLDLANRIHPGLSSEDIRNPHDFPDLIADSGWNFDDGILSGLKAAHMALRAKIAESL
jgi:hypothetical protein